MFVDGDKFIYKSDGLWDMEIDGQIFTFKRYNMCGNTLLCYYEAKSDSHQLLTRNCIPISVNENPEDWL